MSEHIDPPMIRIESKRGFTHVTLRDEKGGECTPKFLRSVKIEAGVDARIPVVTLELFGLDVIYTTDDAQVTVRLLDDPRIVVERKEPEVELHSVTGNPNDEEVISGGQDQEDGQGPKDGSEVLIMGVRVHTDSNVPPGKVRVDYADARPSQLFDFARGADAAFDRITKAHDGPSTTPPKAVE